MENWKVMEKHCFGRKSGRLREIRKCAEISNQVCAVAFATKIFIWCVKLLFDIFMEVIE